MTLKNWSKMSLFLIGTSKKMKFWILTLRPLSTKLINFKRSKETMWTPQKSQKFTKLILSKKITSMTYKIWILKSWTLIWKKKLIRAKNRSNKSLNLSLLRRIRIIILISWRKICKIFLKRAQKRTSKMTQKTVFKTIWALIIKWIKI